MHQRWRLNKNKIGLLVDSPSCFHKEQFLIVTPRTKSGPGVSALLLQPVLCDYVYHIEPLLDGVCQLRKLLQNVPANACYLFL